MSIVRFVELTANGRQMPRQLVVRRRRTWAAAVTTAANPVASPATDTSHSAPPYADKNGNLFGYRVLGLGMEEDRQDDRANSPRAAGTRNTR